MGDILEKSALSREEGREIKDIVTLQVIIAEELGKDLNQFPTQLIFICKALSIQP